MIWYLLPTLCRRALHHAIPNWTTKPSLHSGGSSPTPSSSPATSVRRSSSQIADARTWREPRPILKGTLLAGGLRIDAELRIAGRTQPMPRANEVTWAVKACPVTGAPVTRRSWPAEAATQAPDLLCAPQTSPGPETAPGGSHYPADVTARQADVSDRRTLTVSDGPA